MRPVKVTQLFFDEDKPETTGRMLRIGLETDEALSWLKWPTPNGSTKKIRRRPAIISGYWVYVGGIAVLRKDTAEAIPKNLLIERVPKVEKPYPVNMVYGYSAQLTSSDLTIQFSL